MRNAKLEDIDYWRAIVLYGLNTATYKIALAQVLIKFTEQGQPLVTMPQLAEAFFDLYLHRLQDGKPQLSHPNRLTVMERIVALHTQGQLSREQSVARVEQEAFGDVIPRFHVVNNAALPIQFYEQTRQGLVLTDAAFSALTSPDRPALLDELDSRWSLREAAFAMKREDSQLANDIRSIYLAHGYARTDVTKLVPVLNGYQNGVCFYCGESMRDDDIHVDHVIPRQLVYHDEIWNLVLAHGFCNEQKSDALPGTPYIDKLVARN